MLKIKLFIMYFTTANILLLGMLVPVYLTQGFKGLLIYLGAFIVSYTTILKIQSIYKK
jgi:hypothetical protein